MSGATWNLYNSDTQSYFLPYSNSSFGTQTAIDPQIQVQVDGQTFTAPLDTGSRGASIPQASVPNITQGPNDPSGFLFYWSSGRKIEGYWHDVTLTFPNATGINTGSAPATATVPVLIVQQIVDEAGNWPNGSRATSQTIIPTAGTSFLNFGIGFDRTGDGTSPENSSYNQQYNPFLNLNQMSGGTMVSGYILTQNGIQLGLTEANTAPTADNGLSPFAYDKLIPSPFAQVLGSPPDWQAGTGSVTLNGTPYATGQAVLDIGIPNALLSLPSPPAPIAPSQTTTVSNTSTITVNFLNSGYNVGYTFNVGNTADPMTPQNVTWSAIQTGNQAFSENVDQTTLFNSGRNALNGFNYLYDATNGYIGLQINTPTVTTGAFLTPVIAMQGPVNLPNGFSANYPVLLQNPTTINAGGSIQFAGQVSGSGVLDIGAGGVDLAIANTNSGGIVIGAGATLELSANNAGGTGPINFGGPAATLLIDPGVTPTETIGTLQSGDFIDALGINNGTVATTGNLLTIGNGISALTLTLDTTYFGGQFRAVPDGSGGTMISYVAGAQPYVIPIYHSTEATTGKQNLLVYASLNGGPLDPYLLDTGSPAMYSVYGSWWPGETTPVSQPGTNEITYSSGTSYVYNTATASVALGTGPNGAVLAAANNVSLGQITNLVIGNETLTPQQSFSAWASAVSSGGFPLSDDYTYGNFGAALSGSSSMATVLAQLPISSNLLNGFIIQSGGVSASTGSLTVGLTPSQVAQWEASPSTITLQMDQTGTTLPNPDGNAVPVVSANRAQTNTTTLTLIGNGQTATMAMPLVLDTGGGNNNIIYTNGVANVPNLTNWIQGGGIGGQIINGTTVELTGTTVSDAVETILNYIANPGALPAAGGNTVVDPSGSSANAIRINPGINLYYDYNVMFDLQQGLVLLQQIPCFAAGTRIKTACGMVAVEKLREGDLLPVQFGGALAPITWIGHRRVECRKHPRPETVWPVRVAAHAFADGVPARDVYLSPDHAVFVDGRLIPIKYLINRRTITQVRRQSVTYYHVEVPHHDVVLAEGLAVETYLDVQDRSAFTNDGSVHQLHPDFAVRRWEARGCAELCVTGPFVERLRARLAGHGARRRATL